MEIIKMLTLSTGHLMEDTRWMLDEAVEGGHRSIPSVTVYNKDDYGWFVYIEAEAQLDQVHLPIDLHNAIQFALKNECVMICFDVDGPQEDELQYYEDDN